MKTKLILGSLLIAGAMLASCSDEEVNPANFPMPDVPEQPAADNVIIYEANPRYFATDNCLRAIDSRLDDIKSTGANVLWLMPVCEPGELKSIGSPYCIRNFKALNARYGSMADLKALVDNAHSKGMRVVLDWIANHTAWDCVWITEHPEWYTTDANGNITSPPGQSWTDVADLNYDNADMRAAMIDAMLYWVDNAGIDGFRCDYADGVPADFWNEAIGKIREHRSDALMLGESQDTSLYGAGFDMLYDWSFASALQKYFNNKTTAAELYKSSDKSAATVPAGKSILRYAINHDVIAENSPVQLFGSTKAMEAAQVIATMLYGTPMLYSGQEAGFKGATSFMNYNVMTWNTELVSAYSRIGNAFLATAKARGGNLATYQTGRTATFSRTNAGKSVLVMVNTTDKDVTVKVPITFERTVMTDMLTGNEVTLGTTVTLEGYGYAIFAN